VNAGTVWPRARRALAPVLLLLAMSGGSAAPPPDDDAGENNGAPHETFSVTYTVEIAADDPALARVRWDLEGIDEIQRLRLSFAPERFSDFEGSGTLERRRGQIVWTPGGPYAHLTYRAALDHRRAPGKGFDSYAGDGWVATRTRDLFPRSAVLFRPAIEPNPESRARLVFRLPAGWDVVSAMPQAGPHRFLVESPGRFDHPRGWLLLGRFRRAETTAGATALTVAAVAGSTIAGDRVIALLEQATPQVQALFGRTLPRLLVIVAPDPMWRGGLSGEESFFMHGDRPLQTPDRTSPYLHELFHVAAPFRPAPDAHWVTEGLAEYYTLEIQRRIGRLDDAGYAKGLQLFARYGAWGRDLTRAPDRAMRNDSAPLVMAALDRRIAAATKGARRLDDVVAALAADGGAVSTAGFLGAVQRVAGKSFSGFFRDHVYKGIRPALPEFGIATDDERPGRGDGA
jgi:hypothetical protein